MFTILMILTPIPRAKPLAQSWQKTLKAEKPFARQFKGATATQGFLLVYVKREIVMSLTIYNLLNFLG